MQYCSDIRQIENQIEASQKWPFFCISLLQDAERFINQIEREQQMKKPMMTIMVSMLLLGPGLLTGGCDLAGDETDPGFSMSKDEARAMGGKADSGIDWCEYFGWYGDGICDEFCPLPDPDCEPEQSFNLTDFYQRLNQAVLPGCGTLTMCWYNSETRECTDEEPPEGIRRTIDFKVDSEEPAKRAYMAINFEENLVYEEFADGLEQIKYEETYPKSMPPGPASEIGMLSRYQLTIDFRGDTIERFEIYQEDYDPRSDTWSPWFDIRYNLENPLICE